MSEPVLDAQDGVGTPDGFRRLWTPHRLAYIKARRRKATGMPAVPHPDPARRGRASSSHRGEVVYAVLNLHPYNPGHLMVLPYRHVAELEELTAAESARADRGSPRTRCGRCGRWPAPHAFNVGMNLGHGRGRLAGRHLHQHVVPRWGGDANFIAVIGQTKVIPQLLSETRSLLAQAWPGAPAIRIGWAGPRPARQLAGADAQRPRARARQPRH